MLNKDKTMLLDNNSSDPQWNNKFHSLLQAGFSIKDAIKFLNQRYFWIN